MIDQLGQFSHMNIGAAAIMEYTTSIITGLIIIPINRNDWWDKVKNRL